jgi:hypothetical protein
LNEPKSTQLKKLNPWHALLAPRGGTAAPVGKYACLVIVCLVVLGVGLPAVVNSHWNLLDNEFVIDQLLWPPNSAGNYSQHGQGREFIATGLYLRLLWLILPLQPIWYYLTNFLLHFLVIAVVFTIVYRATKSGIVALIASLVAALASTGPEVFLTLLKQELPMMLAIILALLIVQRMLEGRSRANQSDLYVRLPALTVLTFVAATWGKETFVILPIGLMAALTLCAMSCAISQTTVLRSPQFNVLASATAFSVIGAALVFLERRLVGVRGITSGTYTLDILDFSPSWSALMARLFNYGIHDWDVLMIFCLAVTLTALSAVNSLIRRQPLSDSQLISVIAATAAAAQLVFTLVFINSVQHYYFYPVPILSAVAIGCLWPSWSAANDFCGRLLRNVGRLGTAAAAVTTALAVPTFASRVYVQTVVPGMEWKMLEAIAALPPNALVLLGWRPRAEMVSNAAMMVNKVLERPDIQVAAGINPAASHLVAQAKADHRPAFVAFVYQTAGDNQRFGLRETDPPSRAENLSALAANGVSPGASVRSFNMVPIRFLTPRWRRFTFTYDWELDRL